VAESSLPGWSYSRACSRWWSGCSWFARAGSGCRVATCFPSWWRCRWWRARCFAGTRPGCPAGLWRRCRQLLDCSRSSPGIWRRADPRSVLGDRWTFSAKPNGARRAAGLRGLRARSPAEC
jgi:hypothetical protein